MPRALLTGARRNRDTRRETNNRRATRSMTADQPHRTAWIARSQPTPDARGRLFLAGFAGAGASIFLPWIRAFPRGIDVLPIQLPGREERFREPPVTDLETLVETLADELAPLLDRPFALFGHSMGASIVWRLTEVLRARGVGEPVHLFLSGRAPRSGKPGLHLLPSDRFWERIGAFSGTPPEVLNNRELRELVEPILRADFSLIETAAEPSTHVACPMTVIAGRDDHMAPPAALEGWRELADGPFDFVTLPGDHFALQSRARNLIEQVRARLVPHFNL